MNAEGIEAYIDYLLEQVSEVAGEKLVPLAFWKAVVSNSHCRIDIQAANARRVWIIDQLGALIRNGSIPKTDKWIQSILDWLVVHGFFTIKKKSEKSPYRAVSAMFGLVE